MDLTRPRNTSFYNNRASFATVNPTSGFYSPIGVGPMRNRFVWIANSHLGSIRAFAICLRWLTGFKITLHLGYSVRLRQGCSLEIDGNTLLNRCFRSEGISGKDVNTVWRKLPSYYL